MITLADILNKENWEKHQRYSETISASTLKYVEDEAASIHTMIESLNSFLLRGKYVLTTSIIGYKSRNHYMLIVKIQFYANKKKHKHKKNSHFQEIHI